MAHIWAVVQVSENKHLVYVNTPMQYTANLKAVKVDNFHMKEKKSISSLLCPRHRFGVLFKGAHTIYV